MFSSIHSTPVSKDVYRTAETKLLLYGAKYETKCLSPQQIKQIAEAAQEPDIPLVTSHAMRIEFPVDQDAFLLVQRHMTIKAQLLCQRFRRVMYVAMRRTARLFDWLHRWRTGGESGVRVHRGNVLRPHGSGVTRS